MGLLVGDGNWESNLRIGELTCPTRSPFYKMIVRNSVLG